MSTTSTPQPPEILQQPPTDATPQSTLVTQEDPGQLLGIIGLIIGLVTGVSIVGFILCYVGNKKAKEAGVKSTICVVGMWVNGIYMALTLMFITFFFVFAGGLALLSGTSN